MGHQHHHPTNQMIGSGHLETQPLSEKKKLTKLTEAGFHG